MTLTTFRRAFVWRKVDPPRVGVEVVPGELWMLPNPTAEGKVYAAEALLARVASAGRVDLGLWERFFRQGA